MTEEERLRLRTDMKLFVMELVRLRSRVGYGKEYAEKVVTGYHGVMERYDDELSDIAAAIYLADFCSQYMHKMMSLSSADLDEIITKNEMQMLRG